MRDLVWPVICIAYVTIFGGPAIIAAPKSIFYEAAGLAAASYTHDHTANK